MSDADGTSLTPPSGSDTDGRAPDGYVEFWDRESSSADPLSDVSAIAAVLAACALAMIVGALLPLIDEAAFFSSRSIRLADGVNRAIAVWLPAAGLLASLAAMSTRSIRLLAVSAGLLATPSAFGASIVTGIIVSSGVFGEETSISDVRVGGYLFGLGAIISLVVLVRLVAALRSGSLERRFGLAPITCVAVALLAAAVRVKEIIDFQEDLGWLVTLIFVIALLFLPLAAAGAATATDSGFAMCASVMAGALFLVVYTVATIDGLTLSQLLARTEDKLVIGSYAVGFVVALLAIGGPTTLTSARSMFTIEDRWDDDEGDEDDIDDAGDDTTATGSNGPVPPIDDS